MLVLKLVSTDIIAFSNTIMMYIIYDTPYGKTATILAHINAHTPYALSSFNA